MAGQSYFVPKRRVGGWKEGRKGGWMDGWMDGKAGLRIAYSNQKWISRTKNCVHKKVNLAYQIIKCFYVGLILGIRVKK